MDISFLFFFVRVITEHTYVNGFDIRYFGDEELMNKIRIFHLQLEQLVGPFYGNHYAVEIKVLYGSSIYVGIHDSEMTIGSTCCSHGKVKELTPKENKDKRIKFSFKNNSEDY